MAERSDICSIELYSPTPEALFEPFSVDGHRTLTPAVHEHVLRHAKRAHKHCRLELRIRLDHAGNLASESAQAAIHEHFQRKAELERETLRRSLGYGGVFLVIALTIVLIISALVPVLRPHTSGNFLHGLAESLIVFGWVALWRPMDILLYEWIPVYRSIRLLRRLSSADLKVVFDPPTRYRMLGRQDSARIV
jgi:hypothetical protein